MVKININQKECIGCGFCESCAPEIFEVDKQNFKCGLINNNGSVSSVSLELSEGQLKRAREAAEGCPVQSINIDGILETSN